MLGNHQSAITNEMLTVVNQQFALCIFIGDRRLVITQYLFPARAGATFKSRRDLKVRGRACA